LAIVDNTTYLTQNVRIRIPLSYQELIFGQF
jgi:hypothetical protein